MVYSKKSKTLKRGLGYAAHQQSALQQCMESETDKTARGSECSSSTTSQKHNQRLPRDVITPCDRVLRSRRGATSCTSRRLQGYIGRPQKRLFTPEIKRRLKEWLVKRRRYPYPTRDEKRWLAQDTGLDYNQICNWFANWRRKLKNAECEVAGEEDNDKSDSDLETTEEETTRSPISSSSWGRRILLYNNIAARNAEKIPIACNSSILEDESEDFGDEYVSDTTTSEEDSSQDFTRLDARCIDTTAMDHCYSLLPPTNITPDKNGNYKSSTSTECEVSRKTPPDLQQAQKWLESVERYKPQKQTHPTHLFVTWGNATPTQRSKSSERREARLSSRGLQSVGSSQRHVARDEMDAAEALTALARASRT